MLGMILPLSEIHLRTRTPPTPNQSHNDDQGSQSNGQGMDNGEGSVAQNQMEDNGQEVEEAETEQNGSSDEGQAGTGQGPAEGSRTREQGAGSRQRGEDSEGKEGEGAGEVGPQGKDKVRTVVAAAEPAVQLKSTSSQVDHKPGAYGPRMRQTTLEEAFPVHSAPEKEVMRSQKQLGAGKTGAEGQTSRTANEAEARGKAKKEDRERRYTEDWGKEKGEGDVKQGKV